MSEKLPNCLHCVHYFITYEPSRPYGCRAMGFKSKLLPSRVVLESSGMNCQLFSSKKNSGPNSGGGSDGGRGGGIVA